MIAISALLFWLGCIEDGLRLIPGDKYREQQLWLGVWRGSHGGNRSPKRSSSTWRKRELRAELVGLSTCNITRPIVRIWLRHTLSELQYLSGIELFEPKLVTMTRLLMQTSEFPSLSNNAQMSNPNQSSMWSTAGSRNLGGPSPRNQATPQQGGQDDMFSPTSSRGQGGFRFGNQGNIGQQTQSSSVDDFPPLNQTSNGEMGSDRTASLMSSLGFSSQATGAGPSVSNRGNGLLNALSATSRANEARSPPGIGAPGRFSSFLPAIPNAYFIRLFKTARRQTSWPGRAPAKVFQGGCVARRCF